MRADVPRRPTTSNQWSGGGYLHTERRAAKGNPSDGFHSKKGCSVNHGNPNTLDQYHERSISEESITYHKKGENMGRSNEEKNSTHTKDVHANNGQRIRKEHSRNHKVTDEDCMHGRGMGEGLTGASTSMGLENDTALRGASL